MSGRGPIGTGSLSRTSGTDRATSVARAIAAVAIASTTIGIGHVAAQDAAPPGDVEKGRQLFYEHGCYGCHGFNGETGAQDLVGTGSPIVENVDLFLTFLRLRADQAPLLPSTRMPNYPESALSDTEARDIFAFVASLELNAPDPDTIPAFQAILDSARELD